ncbi:MAG: ABC transporter permease subunit [Anaerolineae bacterium]|nr:ABC transporter permease subunit [Anaerolineae bacterium]NIN98572.1 ABC transporter permease subunit [Anaerolineae bacterium]NIQ81456.1 ABC transporter permease subunit [Anaerolineae bacterium]
MTSYVIRRLLSLIPTLLGVSIIVFLFLRMIPGDPALALAGEHATEANVERIREEFGLNKPLHEQYLTYMGKVLRGDLGRSILSRRPIMDEIRVRFPATIELSICALTVALFVGVPAGMISATRRNSIFDNLAMVGSLLGISMPIFWLGLMLNWFFAVQLGWLPSVTRLDAGIQLQRITNLLVVDSIITGNAEALLNAVQHLILPAIALGTIPMAIIARMTRSAMLEVLEQDYMRTARAKGLVERVVIMRHALKNALLPVITIVGLQVGVLLSGAVLTETIFAWPGIGRWLYLSILSRDYPIIQGMALFITVLFLVINLLVDVSYAVVDPRIRYD